MSAALPDESRIVSRTPLGTLRPDDTTSKVIQLDRYRTPNYASGPYPWPTTAPALPALMAPRSPSAPAIFAAVLLVSTAIIEFVALLQ